MHLEINTYSFIMDYQLYQIYFDHKFYITNKDSYTTRKWQKVIKAGSGNIITKIEYAYIRSTVDQLIE